MTERIQVNLTLLKEINRALELESIERETPKYQIAERAIAAYLGIDINKLVAAVPPAPSAEAK